ncbi:MAG: hypothetical protein ACLT3I_03385 [Ruminococcus sp.]
MILPSRAEYLEVCRGDTIVFDKTGTRRMQNCSGKVIPPEQNRKRKQQLSEIFSAQRRAIVKGAANRTCITKKNTQSSIVAQAFNLLHGECDIASIG